MGKEDEQYNFELGEETIQTKSEKPVKGLGRLYTDDKKNTK